MGLMPTLAWCLSPNTALAEPPHYRVELSVPQSLPECNREPDFVGMVLPMLAGPVLDPPAARVLVVRIAKTRDDYLVDVIVRDLEGKTLEEERADFPADMSCHEVLYRAAIRAAVRMNKGVRSAKAQCPPPPSPPAPSPIPVCEMPPPTPKTEPKERRWFVGLGGFVSFGAAPATVAGLQLVGGWKWSPSWSIELNARGTFPTDGLMQDVTPVLVDFVVSGAAAPCYRKGAFGICGLVALGHLWFSTWEIAQPRSATAASAGLGLRGFLEHRISERWSVRFDAELAARVMHIQTEDARSQLRWPSVPLFGSASATLFVWP